jgi:DnaA regulatory inactivator Hda
MTQAQQLLLELPLKPNYSKTDFVESSCNGEAIQWIERWPDWPVKMIAIFGETGCGKTHLAHIWQEKAQAKYLTPSDIHQLSPLEATQDTSAIVLDDVDLIVNEKSSQDWLFHFYNLMKEDQKDLLLCCQTPPTQWPVSLPDLKSRLATVMSIAVNPPDEEALKAVLFKLCSERGMTLSADVGEYILRRVERSFDSIRSLVATLDQHTLSQHRQLTLGLVREVFKDF